MPKVQISTEEKRGTPSDTSKRSKKVMTRCKDLMTSMLQIRK